jgi:hypothetical protein
MFALHPGARVWPKRVAFTLIENGKNSAVQISILKQPLNVRHPLFFSLLPSAAGRPGRRLLLLAVAALPGAVIPFGKNQHPR